MHEGIHSRTGAPLAQGPSHSSFLHSTFMFTLMTPKWCQIFNLQKKDSTLDMTFYLLNQEESCLHCQSKKQGFSKQKF